LYYKLVGFAHRGSVRQFFFERVANSVVPVRFTVLADVGMARKFNLSLQQLPSICARLLEGTGEDRPAGTLFLSEADMSVSAAENAAAAAEDAARRAMRSQRGALAAASRTHKRVDSATDISVETATTG
jgi:hypothetical protein